MPRTFLIEVKGNKEQIFKKLKHVAKKRDWKLEGSATKGKLIGEVVYSKFSCRYTVLKGKIRVAIIRKPSFITSDTIENLIYDSFRPP